MNALRVTIVAAGISALISGFTGCSKGSSPQPTIKPGTAAAPESSIHDAGGEKHASGTHDHSGWWCDEHGVPEEECGQCNAKLAAAFQKKGDWCKEHDRPDSQCFICHPEYEAAFAAKYEAKFGKKPPKPQVN